MEEWKEVGESWFEVSRTGKVRYKLRSGRYQELDIFMSDNGRKEVDIFLNGKPVTLPIYRLVARAFLGQRPKGHDTHHIDFDKANDNAENLEYLTRKEHHALHTDAWKCDPKPKKPSLPKQAKRLLKPEIVELKENHDKGRTAEEAVIKYGISLSVARKIGKRTLYSQIGRKKEQ